MRQRVRRSVNDGVGIDLARGGGGSGEGEGGAAEAEATEAAAHEAASEVRSWGFKVNEGWWGRERGRGLGHSTSWRLEV